MANEKKIIFSGDDQVSQTANKIFIGIFNNAKKYTDNLKEQNSYIKQQLRDVEKKLQLESQGGLNKAQGMFSSANRLDPGNNQQEARKVAKEALISAEKKAQENSKVIELLQGIFMQGKTQTQNSEKAEKTVKKKEVSAEQQYQAFQSLARQEVRENKEGVISKIRKAEKTGYKDLDPQQAEKLMYQKSIIGSDSKSQSMFAQVFTGTLLAGLTQKIVSSLGNVIGAQSGEQGFNSLLHSIPIAGGILGGAADKTFEEQYAVRSKELELQARTGKKINGASNINAGFSTRESLGITDQLITASGNAGGANQTDNAMLLQRGLGLSTQVIAQIVKDTRTARSTADMIQIVTDVIHANPELRKDQTKLAEVLAQSSQLTAQLSQQTENVNMGRNAGLIGALRSIGGSFADPNLGGQRMMSINSALTSPGTEYQKARSFGVLSGLNPGQSYFQTLEQQEQGIGSKGYLGGTLRQLKQETGGGENFMLSAMNNLNLPASSARKLVEAFEKNPKMFDNFAGGKDDLNKILGSGGLMGRAGAMTSEKDKQKADIDNAFLQSESAGIAKVASLTMKSAAEKLDKAVDKFSEISFLPGVGIYNPLYKPQSTNSVAEQ